MCDISFFSATRSFVRKAMIFRSRASGFFIDICAFLCSKVVSALMIVLSINFIVLVVRFSTEAVDRATSFGRCLNIWNKLNLASYIRCKQSLFQVFSSSAIHFYLYSCFLGAVSHTLTISIIWDTISISYEKYANW